MKFKCPDSVKFDVNDDLEKTFTEKGYKVETIDGVKIWLDGGWVLLRPSNTQPVIRMFVAATDQNKLDEIKNELLGKNIDLIIINHQLSASQNRNLEKFLSKRVIDKTELILDIFATRASSYIGKLQVELAQLNHLSTRLIRGWTHLERQKGGIGLRGPGETQLETDRRLIGKRIKRLNSRLNKAHKQREINRYSRKKSRSKIVALVGYTNAGKTTLFNKLIKYLKN